MIVITILIDKYIVIHCYNLKLQIYIYIYITTSFHFPCHQFSVFSQAAPGHRACSVALDHRHVLAVGLSLRQRAAQHALLRRAVGRRDSGGAAVVVDGHAREGHLGPRGWTKNLGKSMENSEFSWKIWKKMGGSLVVIVSNVEFNRYSTAVAVSKPIGG